MEPVRDSEAADTVTDGKTPKGCCLLKVTCKQHPGRTFKFMVKRMNAKRFYCSQCEKAVRSCRKYGFPSIKVNSIKRLPNGSFETSIFEFAHICVEVEKQLADPRFDITTITPGMKLSYFEIPGDTNTLLRHISPPPVFLLFFADKVSLKAFHDADDIIMDRTKFTADNGQFLYFGHAVFHELPEKQTSYLSFAFLMNNQSSEVFTEAFKRLRHQLDLEFPDWRQRRRRFHINGPKHGVQIALGKTFPEDSVVFLHVHVQAHITRFTMSQHSTLLQHPEFVRFQSELIGSSFLPLDLYEAFVTELFLAENLPDLADDEMTSLKAFIQHYQDNWFNWRANINQFTNGGPRLLCILHGWIGNGNISKLLQKYDTLVELVQMMRRMFSAMAIEFKDSQDGTVVPIRRKIYCSSEKKIADAMEALQSPLNAGKTLTFDSLRAYCRHQHHNFNKTEKDDLSHPDAEWKPEVVEPESLAVEPEHLFVEPVVSLSPNVCTDVSEDYSAEQLPSVSVNPTTSARHAVVRPFYTEYEAASVPFTYAAPIQPTSVATFRSDSLPTVLSDTVPNAIPRAVASDSSMPLATSSHVAPYMLPPPPPQNHQYPPPTFWPAQTPVQYQCPSYPSSPMPLFDAYGNLVGYFQRESDYNYVHHWPQH